MRMDDYDAVFHLWSSVDGLCLGEDDGRERIALYLSRNPGLCFVAVDEEEIVGAVLSGHDGRRGILRHLAVAENRRNGGIAKRLVQLCMEGLARQGIQKCNVHVMDLNGAGLKFWEYIGFSRIQDDYRTLQRPTSRLTL